MTLSDMIEEVSLELDRDDVDARIKRWLQQAIDSVFTTLKAKGLEEVVLLTTETNSETLPLPDDYSDLVDLRYTPGDSSGNQLLGIHALEWFRRHVDQTTTGYPDEYCFFAGKIYFSPIPSGVFSLTFTYKRASANIYTHTINFIDDDNAASTGVAVYLDEDAVDDGIGKLYFVSPTETDGRVKLVAADGHQHEVIIYHSANAATLGVPWYFDEDGGTVNKRNLFVSPTQQDCVVRTEAYRNHTHYVKFIDDADAAVNGVSVYLDEDAAVKTQRLLFVSPTDTNGTSECELSKSGNVPPFVDRYHEVLFLNTVARGLRYEKQYAESNALLAQAGMLLRQFQNAEVARRPRSIVAKPFSARRTGIWDSLQQPEIDD